MYMYMYVYVCIQSKYTNVLIFQKAQISSIEINHRKQYFNNFRVKIFSSFCTRQNYLPGVQQKLIEIYMYVHVWYAILPLL